jgi:hypothetical protein
MVTPPKKFVRLRIYNENYHTTYVELADHPHESVFGCVRRSVNIHNLVEDYDGPAITIDFDEKNRAIGIEILYPYTDEEAEEDIDQS